MKRLGNVLAALWILFALLVIAFVPACATTPCVPKVVYQSYPVPVAQPIPPPPVIAPPNIVTPSCGPGDTVQQIETTSLANDAELIRWGLDEAAALKEWGALAKATPTPTK